MTREEISKLAELNLSAFFAGKQELEYLAGVVRATHIDYYDNEDYDDDVDYDDFMEDAWSNLQRCTDEIERRLEIDNFPFDFACSEVWTDNEKPSYGFFFKYSEHPQRDLSWVIDCHNGIGGGLGFDEDGYYEKSEVEEEIAKYLNEKEEV